MARTPLTTFRLETATLDGLEAIRSHLAASSAARGTPVSLADAVRFAVRETVSRLEKKKSRKAPSGIDPV